MALSNLGLTLRDFVFAGLYLFVNEEIINELDLLFTHLFLKWFLNLCLIRILFVDRLVLNIIKIFLAVENFINLASLS